LARPAQQSGNEIASLRLKEKIRDECVQLKCSAQKEIGTVKNDLDLAGNLAQFPVARQDRVNDQVYRHLRHAILTEQIPAGTRLRETEIAAGLKVSRTPVREAISRLIGDWLVREISTGGVEVNDAMAEITEIYHIRQALELCAARLAAVRITPEQLKRLDALVKEAGTASFNERVRINQDFHLMLAEASGSVRLLEMIRGFREYFLNRRWISRQNSQTAKQALVDHKKIVAALRSRDPEKVETLLRKHLKLGWDELNAHLKAD
jgi:DNA-binding GntR family transcriptional regulator